jgi:hypothetical protein
MNNKPLLYTRPNKISDIEQNSVHDEG